MQEGGARRYSDPSRQQILSDGWHKYFGFRIPPDRILCDGYKAENPRLIDRACPVRPCVLERELAPSQRAAKADRRLPVITLSDARTWTFEECNPSLSILLSVLIEVVRGQEAESDSRDRRSAGPFSCVFLRFWAPTVRCFLPDPERPGAGPVPSCLRALSRVG